MSHKRNIYTVYQQNDANRFKLIATALILLYSACFVYLIHTTKFFQLKGLSPNLLSFFFIIKVLGGIAYAYIHSTRYGGGDSWMYFQDCKIIHSALSNNPLHYFYLLLGPNNVFKPEFIQPYVQQMGYWHDTAAYTVIRLNTIIYLLSFGHYYVHSVFMAFLSFIGLTFIYKTLTPHIKSPKNMPIVFSIFLLPSTVFWSSGLHKESIIVFALGCLLFKLSKLSQIKLNLKNIAQIALCFLILTLARFYVLLILLPPTVAFLTSINNKSNVLWQYLKAYAIVASLILFVHHLYPAYSPIKVLSIKQTQFFALDGNSNVELNSIDNNTIELIKTIPHTLINTMLKPLPWRTNSFYQLLYSIENYILILLFILASKSAFQFKKEAISFQNISYFILFFSFSLIIVIGIVVPNLGAIARYKSVVLPLLFPILLILWKAQTNAKETTNINY